MLRGLAWPSRTSRSQHICTVINANMATHTCQMKAIYIDRGSVSYLIKKFKL